MLKRILLSSLMFVCKAEAALFYIKAGTAYQAKTQFLPRIQKMKERTIGGFSLDSAIGIEYLSGKRIELNLVHNFNDKIDISSFKNEATTIPGRTDNIRLSNRIVSNYKNAALFLNHYFDLGEFDFVKPYVMVGVGYAMNYLKNVRVEEEKQLPAPAPVVPPAAPAPAIDPLTHKVTNTTIYRGAKQKYLVWNVGVGASFQATSSLFIDLTYRFTDYGKLRSTNSYTSTDKTQTPAVVITNTDKSYVLNKFYVHSINLGIRYFL